MSHVTLQNLCVPESLHPLYQLGLEPSYSLVTSARMILSYQFALTRHVHSFDAPRVSMTQTLVFTTCASMEESLDSGLISNGLPH